MKITEFNKFEHNFINAKSEKHKNDFICSTCKVRVYIGTSYDKLAEVINYFNDDNDGEVVDTYYQLSCKEQQIKNLLE